MGAIGLAAGLLLETMILIMRTNRSGAVDDKYAHLLDKRWDQQTGKAEGRQQQRKLIEVDDVKQRKQQKKQGTSIPRQGGSVSGSHAKAD